LERVLHGLSCGKIIFQNLQGQNLGQMSEKQQFGHFVNPKCVFKTAAPDYQLQVKQTFPKQPFPYYLRNICIISYFH